MSKEIDSRNESEKFLTKQKKLGREKALVRSVMIAAANCLDNYVGLDKTLDTVISREFLKAARAEAAKMGATKEQLASFDAAIKVQNDLLKSYKDEGEHVES